MDVTIDPRVIEFLGTLDIAGDAPNRAFSADQDRTAPTGFERPDDVFVLARQIQELKRTQTTDDSLVSEVFALTRQNPQIFLLLMHLDRQIRFTNVELVRLLFDPDRLNDVGYYAWLSETDPIFREVLERVRGRTDWSRPTESGPAQTFDLAAGKRAVHNYLGSGEKEWIAWRSRIEHDPSVAQRVAEFAVRVEDLSELIREDAVASALKRSLRTQNVEQVKAKRGKFGAARVQELLDQSGFVRLSEGDKHTQLSDVVSLAKRRLDDGPYYVPEVKGGMGTGDRKRFDFALANKGRVGFVVETTYYSTSMSKVGEVVKDFGQLRRSLPDNLHLFFITDGIGWFGRVKDVSAMLKVNDPEDREPAVRLPFLLNLNQFSRVLPRIKLELAASP